MRSTEKPREQLEERLRQAARHDVSPPPDLVEHLKAEIPEFIPATRRGELLKGPWFRNERTLLAAAALAVVSFSGWLILRVGSPATEVTAPMTQAAGVEQARVDQAVETESGARPVLDALEEPAVDEALQVDPQPGDSLEGFVGRPETTERAETAPTPELAALEDRENLAAEARTGQPAAEEALGTAQTASGDEGTSSRATRRQLPASVLRSSPQPSAPPRTVDNKLEKEDSARKRAAEPRAQVGNDSKDDAPARPADARAEASPMQESESDLFVDRDANSSVAAPPIVFREIFYRDGELHLSGSLEDADRVEIFVGNAAGGRSPIASGGSPFDLEIELPRAALSRVHWSVFKQGELVARGQIDPRRIEDR